MAFLRNFNEKSRRILKAIVLMAKELGSIPVAEGAETKAQVDFLKQVGCEKIQGYYFGQPMSYEDIQIFSENYEYGQETRREEPVYDKAGLINVVTDVPVAIFTTMGNRPSCCRPIRLSAKSSAMPCPDIMG